MSQIKGTADTGSDGEMAIEPARSMLRDAFELFGKGRAAPANAYPCPSGDA